MTNHDEGRNEQLKRLNNNLSKIKNIILVMSGKGGVGKSSVAASIAYKLSDQGYKTGLMDIDLHGPSIPTMFGLKNEKVYSVNDVIEPIKFNDTLSIVSVEFLLEDTDSPLIWRGPMKIGIIRQFVADVKWDDLDFLIIDSPPGTGDEPLTVAQDIKGAKCVIVTTPQELALSDVRKSIKFCRKLNLDIIGIVENMSYLKCPHCKDNIDLFKGQGSESLKKKFNVEILVKIPFIINSEFQKNNSTIIDLFKNEPEYNKIMDELIEKI